MTSTVSVFPVLGAAIIDLLGHDWEFVHTRPSRTTGSIRHRDGKHIGFVVAVEANGNLTLQAGDSQPLAVLQTTETAQDTEHAANAVVDLIRDSLKSAPVKLDDQLPFETLLAAYHRAERLMNAHIEQVLPRHVEGAVCAALDEKTLTEHGSPLSATFDTTEQDNGYVWLADETQVVLADGTQRTVDLGWAGQCRNFLVDHALEHEVGDDDVLTVTFAPPGLRIA
uniref:hypothetical protein n=1 Tax=Streptomyces sp. F8 TaxID=1436085 RepID=UPI0003D96401|nr:hypothetical protein [Streptomyces sp. F8]AHE40023.1 Hypothetical protein pFRL5_360c [Streptomyces sp. F8]